MLDMEIIHLKEEIEIYKAEVSYMLWLLLQCLFYVLMFNFYVLYRLRLPVSVSNKDPKKLHLHNM